MGRRRVDTSSLVASWPSCSSSAVALWRFSTDVCPGGWLGSQGWNYPKTPNWVAEHPNSRWEVMSSCWWNMLICHPGQHKSDSFSLVNGIQTSPRICCQRRDFQDPGRCTSCAQGQLPGWLRQGRYAGGSTKNKTCVYEVCVTYIYIIVWVDYLWPLYDIICMKTIYTYIWYDYMCFLLYLIGNIVCKSYVNICKCKSI